MNYAKWIIIGIIIIAVLLLTGCKSKPDIHTQEELEQSFQNTLNTVVSRNKTIHNAVLMVQGPDFVWKGAAGMADPDAGLEMLPDDQFRTASSAKMMLATLTMKLAEQGVIDLDKPIADYLPQEIIDGLHVFEGKDYGGEITTRHLLHQTSGIADNWDDDRDESHFLHMVLENPDRMWEPVETIDYVKENLPPLFAPGEGVNYSDINYVLAGLVIESATGQPLHEIYRAELFEPLGMEHTYMELREDPRPSIEGRTLSHVCYEDVDYTNHLSISADWAGGGLVTTAEDMNIFMNAFLNDQIFSNPESRETMFDWMPWNGDVYSYGLGIMRIQGKTLTIWGHLGVGNAMMFYWPDGDVILTGTLNQQDYDSGAFMTQILKAIESYQENQ